jgi:hypothetical protein
MPPHREIESRMPMYRSDAQLPGFAEERASSAALTKSPHETHQPAVVRTRFLPQQSCRTVYYCTYTIFLAMRSQFPMLYWIVRPESSRTAGSQYSCRLVLLCETDGVDIWVL